MAKIDQVNETVFFEVIIDEHLKWKSEISLNFIAPSIPTSSLGKYL